MSNQKITEKTPLYRNANDILLTERFSEDMAQLCMSENYSDVTFLVESERFPAHRVILAARSEYFRALLFGGLAESTQSEIKLDVPLSAFKALLKYIYSGHMPLAQMCEENILDILGLANQYGFVELETSISDYLRQYLSLNNVCNILDAARLYNMDELSKVCLTFIDRNADEILQHESFRQLSQPSIEEILKRDSFFVPEVEIFLAVSDWCKHHEMEDTKSVISLVRYPLISLANLLRIVRPTGILEADKLLDAIQEQHATVDLPYRAARFPEENVATGKFGARTIHGENRNALLDGDYTTYDMEKGYARHCIAENRMANLTIELGSLCIINYIKMLLWDRDVRAYSYYIEVSVDQSHWTRVIDYTNYYCRSWQYLFFEARPVRYIRLVGTHNTINKVFHVVHVEAMYTANVPKLIDGIVVPTANVASIEMGGVVIDGVSRTRNALLNGDFINYDWDCGYTCHQLGSGEIVVRLAQPYYIGTMRLLLWDLDDRRYSFYIETSVNQKDWQIAVDKRNEEASSWQNFSFPPRPVVCIRIVGTRNTANEIFHCVHLECPSQDAAFLQKEKEKEKLREDAAAAAAQLSKVISTPTLTSTTTTTTATRNMLAITGPPTAAQFNSPAVVLANDAEQNIAEGVLINLSNS